MTLSEFIHMGGYAAYVWSSYALFLVVMLLNVIQPVLRERKTIRDIKKRLQEKENN